MFPFKQMGLLTSAEIVEWIISGKPHREQNKTSTLRLGAARQVPH